MTTRQLATLPLLLVLGAPLGGCSMKYFYRYSPPLKHTTEIIYKENDFRLVKTHLTGSASCGYFLGIATGDPRITSQALRELYQAAEGAAVGRATQLVNWTLDETSTGFPFPGFSIFRTDRVVFSADLIEFVK